MYYFHKKYHKSITVQHYIAQLVGYVVGLMNKLHLWMYSWDGPLLYVENLLYSGQKKTKARIERAVDSNQWN